MSFLQYCEILCSRGEKVFAVGIQPEKMRDIPNLGRVIHPIHDYRIVSDINNYVKLLGVPYVDSKHLPMNVGMIILGCLKELVMSEFEIFFDRSKRFAIRCEFKEYLYDRIDKEFFEETYDDCDYFVVSRKL